MKNLILFFLIVLQGAFPSGFAQEIRLGVPLGHTNAIYGIQYSPDGKLILTSSGDYTAKIWCAQDGKLLYSINGEGSMTAKFSRDGKQIITCDGTIKCWETLSGNRTDSIGLQLVEGYDKFWMITSDDRFIILSNKLNEIIFVETATGNVYKRILMQFNSQIECLDITKDNKYIAIAGDKDSMVYIWDTSEDSIIAELRGQNGEITSLKFSPSGNEILIASISSSFEEHATLLNYITGTILFNTEIDFPSGFRHNRLELLSFSPNCRYYTTPLWQNDTSILNIWKYEDDELQYTFKCDFEIHTVKFSPDSKLIALAGDGKAEIFDLSSGKSCATIEDPIYTGWLTTAGFSPDGNSFVLANRSHALQFNTRNWNLISDITGYSTILRSSSFNKENPNLLMIDDYFYGKRIWNYKSGGFVNDCNEPNENWFQLSREIPDGIGNLYHFPQDWHGHTLSSKSGSVSFKNVYSESVNYDLDLISLAYWNGNAEIYNWKQDEHILFEGHSSVVLTANISVDNKFLFTSSNDGTCKIWDIASQNELMTLVLIDSADYIVKTPSGLFDATPGAMEKMYWVKGLDVIEFNQLKDRYWEPGLWEKVMKGEQLRDVRGMNEIKLQPEVELAEITDEKLPINLTRRDGGYGRVVILINGKEVEADARGNGFDTTKTQQTILYNLKDNPLLVPGQENTIVVKAWSADGFLEGRGTVIKYVASGDSVYEKPSLYAVVLGVSDYSTAAIHLNYAKPDATAMAGSIQLGAENLFGKDRTFVYTLTSPGALIPTKENIQKVFTEIKAKAKPSDILLLYMSGHGITWGGDGGDFYYLTADAYSSSMEAYNDPAIRAKNAISTMEFTEWIKEIPALKQVMIIDACGSGKAVDNLLAQRDVDASQIKAIDRMKDRTGMFIISGCAADAVSYEASRYGQGLLTYTILQAMKGAALKEDKYVDVNTLLNYAREQVPLLAAGVGGLQQPQLLIPKGGSFDIGLLDENARKQIVLASPKPVFVRSTFLDADQLEDIISLAKSVDEALGGLSFKGNDSPIIFVDTRDYPDGCKISGTYLQKDGLFTLNGKIKCGSIETPLKLSGISKEKLVEEIINIVNKL